ncbi:bifunctional 4-hydroxy-3-methylbut-2-enyl diphosphate reductase/30S ribosomal protein S1 [Anaerofilum sp. An201]|nr:bifunctional 4-hydroxy-3-methylbut-2-enyl diphosphate reductase/30S ribosomal protein S1 [Anaerofilum sp. An201]OUP04876.1 bifunctional 4-hydroxy-3-methylbut-2-enyl diphosphate reductase/30S ribosomal protein S1 [Anaerofilum sp. An201]
MEIIKAKTAGFCFGVDRAVTLTYDLVNQGRKVATLGPLIHNPQCVADLAARGVVTADTVEDIPEGYEAVIRSHGVSAAVERQLRARCAAVHDATCPFVAKIHRIARRASEEGKLLLVAGDAAHPEVQGIVGHTDGEVFVFGDLAALQAFSTPENCQKPAFVVAQTTFQVTKWEECSEFLKKAYTNAAIFDTICNATSARQKEAEELSRRCDLMVVIGGHHSSNTQKLVSVARRFTRAVAVETAGELSPAQLRGVHRAGVTAGASTPSSVIEEVLDRMSDVIREEELSFEEMINGDSMKPVRAGDIVKGVVTRVLPNEIQVDIDGKQTGIVKFDDFTDDASVQLSEAVKEGEELELYVLNVRDQEGIANLSRKKLEENKGRQEVREAAENGTVLEGDVTEVNKGGLVVKVKGVRVFVPASQTTLRRNEDYTTMDKQKVQLVIKEYNPPRRIVGSIREVLAAEADAKRAAFWETVEEGKTYTGVVKSLTSYGAFVDIGGVDGLVHISELSWNRIKHPSEVVNVGDTVEVYVKALDRENQKVSLGYKKMEDNPWEKLKNEYPIGSIFTAPVVSLTKFGAFVRILPGVDGLVHISEISNERVEKVQDVLKVGDEVTVKLLDVDFDKKRISLSMKAAVADEETDAE